jgi:hypothetical protein
MSDRYTSTDARNAVARLARALKRPTEGYVLTAEGRTRGNIGALVLYHDAGGYNVHEITSEGGGVNTPFGDYLMTARELCRAVRVAEGALWLAGTDRAAVTSAQGSRISVNA